jgi:hypothetical protein
MTQRFEDNAFKNLAADNSQRRRTFDGKTPPEVKNEEQKVVTDRRIRVKMADSENAIVCDDGGCSWSNKDGMSSINMQKNGDVIMLSGSGGNGNACGGRLLINVKSGQVTKSGGPIIVEASASDTAAPNGDGSGTTESSAKSKIASSNMYYGDAITECHGEVRIKGTNIVLEATDVLSLIGKTKVLIQAGPNGGGEIQLNAGQIVQTSDTSIEEVLGQKSTTVAEKTDVQFDPRASVNIISPGHVNWQVLGDYQQNIGGVANITALGKPSVPPLVKERTNSYAIRTVGATGKGISIDSATLVSINSAAAMTIGSVGALNVTSGAATITPASINVLSGTGASITATTGNVDITAIAGNVNVKGLLIYLN